MMTLLLRGNSLAAGTLLFLFFLATSTANAARVGDEFRTVRGDDQPGSGWSALITTSSGRLLAVGGGGGLMVSDNSGVDWDFRKLTIDGEIDSIRLSDVVEFGPNSGMGQTRLAAIGVWLESGISSSWPFAGRTYIFLSSDDGDTWSRHPFPEVRTTHDVFGPFDGVTLRRLFTTSDGRLLAYGTTMVSNLFVTWSVGGLIYRSNDGISWTRSSFENGPIEQISDSSDTGRMVAAGYSTMTDSADGAGWNGYLMRAANVTAPSGPLSFAERDRLSVEDVVIHEGHYVASAAIYVPYDANTSTNIPNALYNLDSATPFDGARAWTAREKAGRYGKLVSDGGTLASIGLGGVYTSSNNGQSWSRPVSDPVATGRAFTRKPGGDWFGIGRSSASNPGLAVWKGSGLSSWTKVFDRPKYPSMARPLGASGQRLFACGTASGGSGSINSIYASFDNGETWSRRATGLPGCVGKLVRHSERLLVPDFAGGVNFSDDDGETWQNFRVLPPDRSGASSLTRTPNGRLILAGPGSVISYVYVSDNGGDTWSERPWPLSFNEQVKDMRAVGNRRIIALTQSFASFDPRLMISDDNGDTWRLDESLQTVAGLPQAGGSLIELQQIVLSPTGRIIIRGDDAIVTSDDNGNTWQYRFGTFHTNGLRAGPWWGKLHELIYMNRRWMMPMVLRNLGDEVIDHKYNWMLVSDDDGSTWFRREIPSRFERARWAMKGEGRVVVMGTEGAIWVSDGEEEYEPDSARVLVRAGDSAEISVPRPPIPGALDLAYATVPDAQASGSEAAIIGTHYDEVSGVLSWAAGDNSPRTVEVPTYNTLTSTDSPMRRFLLRLSPHGVDMDSVVEVPVSIMNTGRALGSISVQLMEMDSLVMTVGGEAKTFRVALASQPTLDVTLNLDLVEPAMASISSSTLVFTNANWHIPQSITVTPVDSSAPTQPNYGSSYEIRFTPDSEDPAYGQHLPEFIALYRYPADVIFQDRLDDYSEY